MDIRIDHAVFAWSDREALVRALAAVGLEPETGGTHGDGTTHMSLLGFDDGSYLEVISNVPGEDPRRWPERITTDAGPAAWAIRVPEVSTVLKTGIDAGVEVRGPRTGSRERTDGTLIEWDSGFYADDRLPFMIADRTPRRYRVSPSESVVGGPLTGVAEVVLGVPDLEAAVEQYRRLYRFPTPRRETDRAYGAELAVFPGQPLTLAAPLDEGRVADRLSTYGPIPTAFLLGTTDVGAARRQYRLAEREPFGDREVRWFEASPLRGRLGVLAGVVGT